MPYKLENVRITSYQTGGSTEGFDFQPQLTSEPTAPAGEVNHSEFAIVKTLDKAILSDEGPEETVIYPSSATAFPGFAGGVRVASGDVNGDDDKPDLLVGVSGSDWIFDFQPQLTTEPTAPQAGKHEGGDWIIVESCQFADNTGADEGYLLTSVESQFGEPVTFTATVNIGPSALI